MDRERQKIEAFYRVNKLLNKVDKKNNLRKILFRKMIIEFRLPDFNEDLNYAGNIIKDLHYQILKNDPEWHMFYEGQYSIIRCQFRFYKKVIRFFKSRNIKYEYIGRWIDGSYVVRKYNKFFKPLFHMYSKLSLELDEEDLYYVSDRVCHCFFNHQTYMAKQWVELDGPHLWEASLMGRLATGRAMHAGRVDYHNYLTDKKKLKQKTLEE